MLPPASDQTATQAANAAAAAAGIRAVMLSRLERRSVMGIVTPGRKVGNTGTFRGIAAISRLHAINRRAIVSHRSGQSSTPRASGLRRRRLDRAGGPER